MTDYTLVLNAGSSSLKFSVFGRPEGEEWRLESRGQIEGIGSTPHFLAKDGKGRIIVDQSTRVRDGSDALETIAKWLRATYHSARLVGVGHRVVHGGDRYAGPVIITPQVMAELRHLIPLAPLHQPYNLAAIDSLAVRLPGVPQVACFDTSFHRTQPDVAQVIPLPPDIRCRGVQRYGFHGLSYEYVASVLPRIAPDIAKARVIVAHLGSGASLCAMRAGHSVDCTFGFTALDGLCMGTRPGGVDPGVILYLFQNLRMSAAEVEAILYKRSGLLGISGISSDMRKLLRSKDPGARLALEYFVYRAKKEVGAMAASLGGIDALVFTAGIGENSAEIRRLLCESVEWLGIELDAAANESNASRISRANSRISVWVIPANEELMIARHTGLLLGLAEAHADARETSSRV